MLAGLFYTVTRTKLCASGCPFDLMGSCLPDCFRAKDGEKLSEKAMGHRNGTMMATVAWADSA